MPTAKDALLEYEADQTPVDMVALTDQGDHKEFLSAANLWSRVSGKLPDVKPNGVATGLVVSVAASGSDDVVDVSAGTVYLAGVLTSVDADTDLSIPRPASSAYQKLSITINSSGALAVVEGAEHTAHSNTRGANGGPPWIPTGSVEIAQIHYYSTSSAAVAASEIKQVVGTHREKYNYPVWQTIYGQVESGVLGYAGINMVSALPLIHSDDAGSTTAPKKVYASYYTPSFAEIVDAYAFKPPAAAYSVSSKTVYNRVKGSASSSLNQGSFSYDMEDGISDAILAATGQNLWFRFYQDRLNAPYILAQGILGVEQEFPADDDIVASCVIAADAEAMRVTG